MGLERILKMGMSLATESRRRRIIRREAIGRKRERTRVVAKMKAKKKTTKSSIEDGDS